MPNPNEEIPIEQCPLYDATRCNRRRANRVAWHESSLATWIGLFSLLFMLIGGAITFGRTAERQITALQNLTDEVHHNEAVIELLRISEGDPTRHVDPIRDEARWRVLDDRLARIEIKLDKLR